MTSGMTDTTPAAAQVQIALLRTAVMARRIDLAADLTRFARAGAFAALRRRYPTADAGEISLLFVEQQYGAALAQRLRPMLLAQDAQHAPIP